MSVSLAKGSSLSLKKADGSALTNVRLGLGWDAVQVKRGFFGGGGSTEIDLDASALEFDANGNLLDAIFFGQLNSRDGAIRHTGDNLTGDGDGDDEQIVVNLAAVPANVQSIVFVITSYSRQTFDKISNVFARVVDLSGGENEVVRFDLAEGGNHTGKIIAKLTREGAGWAFKAIGTPANGRTYKDVVNDAKAAL